MAQSLRRCDWGGIGMESGAPARSGRPVSFWLFLGMVLGVILFAGVIGGVATGIVDETWLPWKVRKLIRFLDETGTTWMNLRGCLCREDQTVTIPHRRGIMLAGSLYGLHRGSPKAKILLIHGNTPLGRKLAMYRVLASQLAERGFVVLTIDTPGHGESDDPLKAEPPLTPAEIADLSSAVEFLDNWEVPGGPTPIFLIGHSGGATPAMWTGLAAHKIAGIIAIGPPRRTRERIESGQDFAYFWERARRTHEQVYGHSYPAWFTQADWLERVKFGYMERYLPHLQQAGHVPVLFLDGERESPEDQRYLRAYVEAVAEPKAYATIDGSDHYANTIAIETGLGTVNLYDQAAVETTVDTLVQWMDTIINATANPAVQ
ncbi:MAG: alpha/beta fold hydrolase [Nitrospirae bacterium]|nr:MAG: alpha/beta fold hydrolase [Nitrospirota bacterium]